MEKINLIEVEQPIGTFYLGKINSDVLVKHYYVNPRYKDKGIQRPHSVKRVKEIADYCRDPDATFPTPIIVSITTKDLIPEESRHEFKKINSIPGGISIDLSDLPQYKEIFEIIDGQHRIRGIELAKKISNFSCELVVVLMIDLTEEEKAYVFSTINSNQAKVDKSLIYDLFELSTTRSPFKTAHYIARSMNSNEQSPFYNRLKMLGKKESDMSTLSQGTFVYGVLSLISKDPKNDTTILKENGKLENLSNYPLRNLFIHEEDKVILKILNDYFSAVRDVFSDEWNSNDSIINKTTGYLGLIRLFKVLFKLGLEKFDDISYNFYRESFDLIKKGLDSQNVKLTSETFPSGASGQNKLAKEFLKIFVEEKNKMNS